MAKQKSKTVTVCFGDNSEIFLSWSDGKLSWSSTRMPIWNRFPSESGMAYALIEVCHSSAEFEGAVRVMNGLSDDRGVNE